MRKMELERRIQRLERVLSPTPEQVVIVKLVDSTQTLQEFPQEPREWITWPAAERRSWTANGVKVVYVDSQAEREARAAKIA